MTTPPVRLAAIDIGTNTVKLLVADVLAGPVTPVAFRIAATRIGAGLSRTGRIPMENARTAAAAVARFARVADRNGAVETFAFATYALRRAANTERVLRQIRRASGLEVHVLTPGREARFAWISARAHLQRPRPDALLFDVGGGSVEVVLAREGRVARASSLPLGAVTLTERFLRSDPIAPPEYETLRAAADRSLGRWLRAGPSLDPARLDLITSGGTATTMLDMLAPAGASGLPRLRRADLIRLEQRCLALTIAARKKLPGLPADRADIIPAGIAVVRSVFDLTRKRVALVNRGGVREGALIHLSQNRLRW